MRPSLDFSPPLAAIVLAKRLLRVLTAHNLHFTVAVDEGLHPLAGYLETGP